MPAAKTPESKRKANDKWDKENMTTLGCKVRKTEAKMFKDYSKKKGKTANTLLKDYVLKCINETMERDSSGSAATHVLEEPKAAGKNTKGSERRTH